MEKRLPLRLARVLRHVLEDVEVPVNNLALKTSEAQKIHIDLALAYIWELVDEDFLSYNTDEATIVRGARPYPDEITPSGYYIFEGECWSCGAVVTRNLDIYSVNIHWDCSVCQVKWVEKVGD